MDISNRSLVSLPFLSLLFFSFFLVQPSKVFSQERIDKAISLFRHENYEEALPLFRELRTQDPHSAQAAYYLGLTYEKLQDYLAAIPELEAAATLEPPEKNASIELISLLYQCDKTDEAKKWIERIQKETNNTAQVAFLKGLVLAKEGKDLQAALQAFDEAKKDASLVESAEYQKGIIALRLKNYKVAKSTFKSFIARNVDSDQVHYANEYLEELNRRDESMRPFHGSLGYVLEYDDNVAARPVDDTFFPDTGRKKDLRHVFTTDGDYQYKINDMFSLKTGYALYHTKNNDQGFYDILTAGVPLQPIITLEKCAISFPLQYAYTTVDERTYLKTMSAGNTNNIMLSPSTMLQTQLTYAHDDFDWAVSNPDDSRTGDYYTLGLGGYYFFGQKLDGFFNLRYGLSYDDTKGRNWMALGNRVTASVVVPMTKKLRWNFVADYCNKGYKKFNTSYNKERHDNIYTISNMLAYEVMKNTEIQLEYIWVYDASRISAYKYRKNVFGLGTKHTF